MIEFSKSGKHLAILTKKDSILSVYDSRDIFKCFEKIENQKPLFNLKIDQISSADKIVFDVMDKMILISSRDQIIIFSLDHTKYGEVIQNYTIDQIKYTAILDVVVNTQELDENSIDMIANCDQDFTYRCQIACKYNGSTTIHFFDINEPSDFRSIIYVRNIGKIIVKISDNFSRWPGGRN